MERKKKHNPTEYYDVERMHEALSVGIFYCGYDDVDLPPRFTAVEKLNLVDGQIGLYKRICNQAFDYLATVEDPDSMEARAHLIKMLMDLEKVCLLPPVIEESYRERGDGRFKKGAKLDILVSNILEAQAQTSYNAVVVFCTYPEILEAIGKCLRGKWGKKEEKEERKNDERKSRIAVITGETSSKEIQRIVEDINSGRIKVVLISDDAVKNLNLNLRLNLMVIVHYNIPWQAELMEERLRCVRHPEYTKRVVELVLLTVDSLEKVKWERIEKEMKASGSNR